MGSILHVLIQDQFALDHPQEGRRRDRAPSVPPAPFGQLLLQLEQQFELRIHDGRLTTQRSLATRMMRLNEAVLSPSGINYWKSITGQYTNSCIPSVCSALTAGNTNLSASCNVTLTNLHSHLLR